MTIDKAKWRRPRVEDEAARKDRNVSVKYSLMPEDHPSKLPVCKAIFLKVLGVSKDRVSGVSRYYAEHATSRPENRGGAHKLAESKVKKT
ncbi:hypothetical protein SKAU_G00018690 [Synaphobranchus kaupii]|uniref:Uncharacterized protein n=1 Tax=Synaphobranchus kaupii TaxID=118154 RepID=A0A9Q1GBD7_SYNKA|nr:hypothetical protein SKAU_G00018690 [Synaphobranchus kaupii]